jgi:hypothetical protein
MERSTCKKVIVLCYDHVYFGGMQLTYLFSVLPGEGENRYFISISLGEETCEADAGSDLVRALEYYLRIREGYVTPCGLDDVMQDLRYVS